MPNGDKTFESTARDGSAHKQSSIAHPPDLRWLVPTLVVYFTHIHEEQKESPRLEKQLCRNKILNVAKMTTFDSPAFCQQSAGFEVGRFKQTENLMREYKWQPGTGLKAQYKQGKCPSTYKSTKMSVQTGSSTSKRAMHTQERYRLITLWIITIRYFSSCVNWSHTTTKISVFSTAV